MGEIFEVELRSKGPAYSMKEPHSHDYYELFFLLEGQRRFFAQNNMLLLQPKTFCVIPPFSMHKTEGESSFVRINVNVSPKLLSKDEINFLDACAKKQALKMEGEMCELCLRILSEASKLQMEWKNKDEYKFALTKTLLYFLQKQNLSAVTVSASSDSAHTVDVLMLKMAAYLNENYQSEINLKMLCEQFFLSKATLCERFKRTMNCSIMEYLLRVRLAKAREFLLGTDKSIEEISELCGFSSANYFGLVFKKATGISPLHYRRR